MQKTLSMVTHTGTRYSISVHRQSAALSGRRLGGSSAKTRSFLSFNIQSGVLFPVPLLLSALRPVRGVVVVAMLFLQVKVSTFVRHPDSSEMLPAEASGRMRPGDELVDINGHSVEGLNGEEATSLIRQVGVDFGCSVVTASVAATTAATQRNATPNKAKQGQTRPSKHKQGDPIRPPLSLIPINNNAAG